MNNTVSFVLQTEAQAILDFAKEPKGCAEAIALIVDSQPPLIVSGVGKSGHVAHKLASTFCSLGKAAIFMHASEASHGDLGLIAEGSVVIILSNSGETTELSDLIAFCQKNGNPIIAITASHSSTLANASNVVIHYGQVREACHNGLAPTTSTTLMMAIGDVLAVGFSEATRKTPEDFRRFHPGGHLARELARAQDVMRDRQDLPLIDKNASIDQVILAMTNGMLGFAILMDGDEVYGVISDGDLRRNAKSLWKIQPKDIASQNPVAVPPDMPLADLSSLMHEKGVSQVLVTQNEKLIGLVHILMISGLGS